MEDGPCQDSKTRKKGEFPYLIIETAFNQPKAEEDTVRMAVMEAPT